MRTKSGKNFYQHIKRITLRKNHSPNKGCSTYIEDPLVSLSVALSRKMCYIQTHFLRTFH